VNVNLNLNRDTVYYTGVHKKTKPTTFSSVSKPQLYAVFFGIAIQETTASLAMIMSPTSPA